MVGLRLDHLLLATVPALLVGIVYVKLRFNRGFLIGELERDSSAICRSYARTPSEISLLELFQIISSLLHNHG